MAGGELFTGLATVLGSEVHDRLGVCTAPRCDRVHVDVSPNGTRRFRPTACQNRVKTAGFRARTKGRASQVSTRIGPPSRKAPMSSTASRKKIA